MLICDKAQDEMVICIAGQERFRIPKSDFVMAGSDEQIETAIKTVKDLQISALGYHLFVHIFSKSPLKYSLYLCPKTVNPPDRWWEFKI